MMSQLYKKGKKILLGALLSILFIFNLCSFANIVQAYDENGTFTASDFNIFYSDACSEGEETITGTDGKTYQCSVLGSAEVDNANYKYVSTSTLVNEATPKKWLATSTSNTNTILYYLSGKDISGVNTGYDYAENTTEFLQSYSIYKYVANWVKNGSIYSTANDNYFSSSDSTASSTTDGSDSLYKYELTDGSDYKIYYALQSLTSDYKFVDSSDYGFMTKEEAVNTDSFQYEPIKDTNGTNLTSREFEKWVYSKAYTNLDFQGNDVSVSKNTQTYYDSVNKAFWIYDSNKGVFYSYGVPNASSATRWTDEIQSVLDGTDGVWTTLSSESTSQIVYYWKQWFNYYVTTESLITNQSTKANATFAESIPSTVYNNNSYTYYTQAGVHSTDVSYTFNYSLVSPVYYDANEYAFTSDWYSNLADALSANPNYTSDSNSVESTKVQKQYSTIDTYTKTYTQYGGTKTSDNTKLSNTSSVLYNMTNTKYAYSYYTTSATYGVDSSTNTNVVSKTASGTGLTLCSLVSGSDYISNKYCLVSNTGTAKDLYDFKVYTVTETKNDPVWERTTDWTTEEYSNTSDYTYVLEDTDNVATASMRGAIWGWASNGTATSTTKSSSYFSGNDYYQYSSSTAKANTKKYSSSNSTTSTITSTTNYTTGAYYSSDSSTGKISFIDAKSDVSAYNYTIAPLMYVVAIRYGSSSSSYNSTTRYIYASDYWRNYNKKNNYIYESGRYSGSYLASNVYGTSLKQFLTSAVSNVFYDTTSGSGAHSTISFTNYNYVSFKIITSATHKAGTSNAVTTGYTYTNYGSSYSTVSGPTSNTIANKIALGFYTQSFDWSANISSGGNNDVWDNYNSWEGLVSNGSYYNYGNYDDASPYSSVYVQWTDDEDTEYLYNDFYYITNNGYKTKYNYTIRTYTPIRGNALSGSYTAHTWNFTPSSYTKSTFLSTIANKSSYYWVNNLFTQYNFNKYTWSNLTSMPNSRITIEYSESDDTYLAIDNNCLNWMKNNGVVDVLSYDDYANGSVYSDVTVPSSFNSSYRRFIYKITSQGIYNRYKWQIWKNQPNTITLTYKETKALSSSYNGKTLNGLYYEMISGTQYYDFTKAHLKVTGEKSNNDTQTVYFTQTEINNGATNSKTATATSNGYKYASTGGTRYYYDYYNVKTTTETATYTGDNNWYDNAPTASQKTSKPSCSITIGGTCYTYNSSKVEAKNSRTLYKYKMYYKTTDVKTTSTANTTVTYNKTVNGTTSYDSADSIYTSHLPSYTTPCSSTVTYNCYIYNGANVSSKTKYYYNATTVTYSSSMANKKAVSSNNYYTIYKNTDGKDAVSSTSTYNDVETINVLSMKNMFINSKKQNLNKYYFTTNNAYVIGGNQGGSLSYSVTGLKVNTTYYLYLSGSGNIKATVNGTEGTLKNGMISFSFKTDYAGNANIKISLNSQGEGVINWVEILNNSTTSSTYIPYTESSRITLASDGNYNSNKNYKQTYLTSTMTYNPTNEIKSAMIYSFTTADGKTFNRSTYSNDNMFYKALIKYYLDGKLSSFKYGFDVQENGNYQTISGLATSFYNSDKTVKWILNTDNQLQFYIQNVKNVDATWANNTNIYFTNSSLTNLLNININSLSKTGSGATFALTINNTRYEACKNSELGQYLMLYQATVVQNSYSASNVYFNNSDRKFYVFSGNSSIYHKFDVYRDTNKDLSGNKLDSGFKTLAPVGDVSTLLQNGGLSGIVYDNSIEFDGLYYKNGSYYTLDADNELSELVSGGSNSTPLTVSSNNYSTLILVQDAQNYNNKQVTSSNGTFKLVSDGSMYTRRVEYKTIGYYDNSSDVLDILDSYKDVEGTSLGEKFINPSDTYLFFINYELNGVKKGVAVYGKNYNSAMNYVKSNISDATDIELNQYIRVSSINNSDISAGKIKYGNFYYDMPYYYEMTTNKNYLHKLQQKDENATINTYFNIDLLKDYYLDDNYLGTSYEYTDMSDKNYATNLEQSLQYSSTLVNGLDSFKLHFNGMYNYWYNSSTNTWTANNGSFSSNEAKTATINSCLFSDSEEEVPEFIMVNTGYANNTISFETTNWHSSELFHSYSMVADQLATYDVYALYAVQNNKGKVYEYTKLLNEAVDILNDLAQEYENLPYVSEINKSFSPVQIAQAMKKHGRSDGTSWTDEQIGFWYANEGHGVDLNKIANSVFLNLMYNGDEVFNYVKEQSRTYAVGDEKNAVTNGMFSNGKGNSLQPKYTISESTVFENILENDSKSYLYENATYGIVEDAYAISRLPKLDEVGAHTTQTNTTMSNTMFYSYNFKEYFDNKNIPAFIPIDEIYDVTKTMMDAIINSWNQADGTYVKLFSQNTGNTYMYKKLSNTNFIKDQNNANYSHIVGLEGYHHTDGSFVSPHNIFVGSNEKSTIEFTSSGASSANLTTEGATAYAYHHELEAYNYAQPYTITTTASINDFVPINYHLKKNNNIMKAYELEFDAYNFYNPTWHLKEDTILFNDLNAQTGFSHFTLWCMTQKGFWGQDIKDYHIGYSSTMNSPQERVLGEHSKNSTDNSNTHSLTQRSSDIWAGTNLAFYAFYGLQFERVSSDGNVNEYIKISSSLSENEALQELALNSIYLNELTTNDNNDGWSKYANRVALFNFNNNESPIKKSIFGYAFVNEDGGYLDSDSLISKAINEAYTETVEYVKKYYEDLKRTTVPSPAKTTLIRNFNANTMNVGGKPDYIFVRNTYQNAGYSRASSILASWSRQTLNGDSAFGGYSNEGGYKSYSHTQNNYNWTMNLGTITFGNTNKLDDSINADFSNMNNYTTDTDLTLNSNSFEFEMNFTTADNAYVEYQIYYYTDKKTCPTNYTYSEGKCYYVDSNNSISKQEEFVSSYTYYATLTYLDENTLSLQMVGFTFDSAKKLSSKEQQLQAQLYAKANYPNYDSVKVIKEKPNGVTYRGTKWNVLFGNDNLSEKNVKFENNILLPNTTYFVEYRLRDVLGNVHPEYRKTLVTGTDMVLNPYYENIETLSEYLNQVVGTDYSSAMMSLTNEEKTLAKETSALLLNESIPSQLYNLIVTIPDYETVLRDIDNVNYQFLSQHGYTQKCSRLDFTIPVMNSDGTTVSKNINYILYNKFRVHITNPELSSISLHIYETSLDLKEQKEVTVKDTFTVKDVTKGTTLVKGQTMSGTINVSLSDLKLKAIANSYDTYDDFVYKYLLNYKTNNIVTTTNSSGFVSTKYYIVGYNYILGEIKQFIDTNLDNSSASETFIGSYGSTFATETIRGLNNPNNCLRKMVVMGSTYYLAYVRDSESILVQ